MRPARYSAQNAHGPAQSPQSPDTITSDYEEGVPLILDAGDGIAFKDLERIARAWILHFQFQDEKRVSFATPRAANGNDLEIDARGHVVDDVVKAVKAV